MPPAQFDQLLKLFVAFCIQEFGYSLYRYQVRIARAVLHALFVDPKDIYIKISRQSGKPESITLLPRFLIIFYKLVKGGAAHVRHRQPEGGAGEDRH